MPRFRIFKSIVILWITAYLVNTEERWFNNSDTKKSYYTSIEEVTWATAKTQCHTRGSKLAVIVDNDDLQFIARLPDRAVEQHWIGLVHEEEVCSCGDLPEGDCGDEDADCMRCRSSWQWYDGTEMGFADWACQRPLGGNRDCAVIKEGGFTFDATSCSNKRRQVCQYDCSPHSCKRTTCAFDGSTYQCICDAGSTGQHCDADINECVSQPCLHGATCRNGENQYECECVAGYTGYNCETEIDECNSSPCLNNGTCIDGLDAFTCDSVLGLTGYLCETDIDECAPKPCNNGTCQDRVNGYVCNCSLGYQGTYCGSLEDKCEDVYCQNGATCEFNVNRYWCICSVGYTGDHCEYGTDSSIDRKDKESTSDIERAFYTGVAFLSIAFICMVMVIVIYVKTMPKRTTSRSLSRPAAENKAGASTNETDFNSF